MLRILDLGCGTGDSWKKMSLSAENWHIIGIDLSMPSLQLARAKNTAQGWVYLCARGERIPLSDAAVDGIFCNVALPYMHIPQTLAELHRVLVPSGWFKASLHSPGFTWRELRRSFPKPRASLFRLFVLANGAVLHCLGRILIIKDVAESCQTKRGMRRALRKAGFEHIKFRREGERFFVEAYRDRSVHLAGPRRFPRAA